MSHAVAGPAGTYVHWGAIQISVANLIMIGLMVLVFAAAVWLPLGRHPERYEVRDETQPQTRPGTSTPSGNRR